MVGVNNKYLVIKMHGMNIKKKTFKHISKLQDWRTENTFGLERRVQKRNSIRTRYRNTHFVKNDCRSGASVSLLFLNGGLSVDKNTGNILVYCIW